MFYLVRIFSSHDSLVRISLFCLLLSFLSACAVDRSSVGNGGDLPDVKSGLTQSCGADTGSSNSIALCFFPYEAVIALAWINPSFNSARGSIVNFDIAWFNLADQNSQTVRVSASQINTEPDLANGYIITNLLSGNDYSVTLTINYEHGTQEIFSSTNLRGSRSSILTGPNQDNDEFADAEDPDNASISTPLPSLVQSIANGEINLENLTGSRFCRAPPGYELSSSLAAAPYSSIAVVREPYYDRNNNLIFEFNSTIELNRSGRIYLSPLGAPNGFTLNLEQPFWQRPFSDSIDVNVSTNLAVRDGTKLVILSNFSSFFHPVNPGSATADLASPILRWDIKYSTCNFNAVRDTNAMSLSPFLASFTSSPAPAFLQSRVGQSGPVLPILMDTVIRGIVSSYRYNQNEYTDILRDEYRYNLTTADLDLDGSDVNVAIYDLGIINASEVGAAVAFRAYDGPDALLTSKFIPNATRPGSISNHATNMARYLLNFAPGVSLYDFFFTPIYHTQSYIFEALAAHGINRAREDYGREGFSLEEYLELAGESNLNISIFSHSGGVAIDQDLVDSIGAAVNAGLIYAKSVGNTNYQESANSPIIPVTNTIGDKFCARDQNFIPYMTDLSNARGAFVGVQAALWSSPHEGIRNEAGDMAPYTITLIENGNGATSEATATFSAMMALMMEQNRNSQAGFTPRQLVEIMFETARFPSSYPNNHTYYGNGILNIGKALQQVRDRIAPQYDLYADVSSSSHFMNHDFNLTNSQDECSRIPLSNP